jgi:transposase
VTQHHQTLLGFLLEQHDACNGAIAKLEGFVAVALEPFQAGVELVKTVPGVGAEVAAALIAEIGTDMKRFPADGHLVSWAGLCPRSDESAGKRRSTKIRNGVTAPPRTAPPP